MAVKRWRGPEPGWCDICDNLLDHVDDKQWFVDGKLKGMTHRWTLMCPDCYELYGAGLGLGKGQKYSVNEPYEKLERDKNDTFNQR